MGTTIVHGIPNRTEVVVVSDFFVEDITGGAELTTEALLQQCPKTFYKIRSSSLTPELVKQHRNKLWMLYNFTQVSSDAANELLEQKIKYQFVEYDFKVCKYRSNYRHLLETGKPCDCANTPHGKFITDLFMQAKMVYWMSQRQQTVVANMQPQLTTIPQSNQMVLSSVFDDSTLSQLKLLRNNNMEVAKANGKWGCLGSGTWIKGVPHTIAWLKAKRLSKAAPIPNLPYKEFLLELSKHKGFVFRPLDYDTCPRTVIEAKLLGCELKLNDNVLHKDEEWFNGTIEECENHLVNQRNKFWAVAMEHWC